MMAMRCSAIVVLLVAVLPVVQVSIVDKRLSSSINLLLDVDTGVDDAMATILAATQPNVSLRAITVTHGNAALSTAYNNTLRVLKVLNRTDVPVYKGADRSIDGNSDYETVYFGPDNFGGVSALYPPAQNQAPDPQARAYLKLIELVKRNPGRYTMVMMAPLTNLAIALLVEPDLLENAKHLYILGGTLYGMGNVRPSVEFNFLSDPEAALVVLQRASCPVTIVPREAFLQATLPWATYNSITQKTGPLQTFLRDTTRHTVQCCLQGSTGFNLGDFLAVLAATVPESVDKTVVHRVDVEPGGTYTRGQLVHAWRPQDLPNAKHNVTIVKSFNTRVVEQYFKQTFDPPRRR